MPTAVVLPRMPLRRSGSVTLQECAFKAELERQLQELQTRDGKRYRIVAPGSALALGDAIYVGTVAGVLPQIAMQTEIAQNCAAYIVVELAYTPPDMRSMFEYAGRHLFTMAQEALALELIDRLPNAIRMVVSRDTYSYYDVGHGTAEEAPVARAHDAAQQLTFSWNASVLDLEFETYMMRILNPTQRFALAVRLWLRVSRVNAHDIVSIVRDHNSGLYKTPLNDIDYTVVDDRIIEVSLPAHDGDIMRDTTHAYANTLATSLASAYPEEALVPCAIAASMSQEDAEKFVQDLRRPHKKRIRTRSEESSTST